MSRAAATRALVVAVAAVATTVGAVSPAWAGPDPGASTGAPEMVRVIVTYDALSSTPAVAASVGSVGTVTRTMRRSPHLVATVPAADLSTLRRSPHVRAVQLDIPQKLALDSSLPTIRADAAHTAGYTGAGTTVAILDTGIDVDHPFLGGRVVAQYCSSSPGTNERSLCPDGTAEDDSADIDSLPACANAGGGSLCDHGTHVAGIAAGNGTGVAGAKARAGVAPGANIIAMQVFTRFDDPSFCGAASCLASYPSDQLRALDQLAVLDTAHPSWNIVSANLSLGSGTYAAACDTDSRKGSIDLLLAQGIATVIAAGNDSADAGVSDPGCISSAVTVGATDDADTVAWFSNRGPLLDVFAPGTGITSSVPDDLWTTMNGTSMAAPHVAGTLALLRQHAPSRPIASLISELKSSGIPVTYPSGKGIATTARIDVLNAIEASNGPRLALTGTPAPAPEGSALTLAGTWTEGAAGGPVSLTASIGTVTLGPGTWSWTATRRDDATLPVTITATDAVGASRPLTLTARWSNVAPIATLTPAGTRTWNGSTVTFARVNTPATFSVDVTDPGSDDLSTAWGYGDGGRTVARSLLHPPPGDLGSGPAGGRSLRSTVAHTYTRACTRTLTVRATDDDGGASPTRSRQVVALGASGTRHSAAWWTAAYRGVVVSVSASDRPCLLSTARALSMVLPEKRALTTTADALAVLLPAKAATARSTFDAHLLAVWLDVAGGSVDPFGPLDADRNGSAETTVAAFLRAAETTRNTSSATSGALPPLTQVLVRISTTG